MTLYADLEIGLHRREADAYTVEFRFSRPSEDIEHRDTGEARIDLEALRVRSLLTREYGMCLTKMLFDPPALRGAFDKAVAIVREQVPAWGLRVRLMVGPSTPELHSVHWETLLDPASQDPLMTSDTILFSRYLASLDWRPVRLRPKRDLKALVIVSNPSNLSEFGLAPVDVDGELKRAKESLGKHVVKVLPDGEEHATFKNLLKCLRVENPDIVYIVCHGALNKDSAYLWLENDEGAVQRVSGSDLIVGLRELPELPRLVVLASCESAGVGSGEALAALGPKLAEAGIPAVLAMQGSISMDTVKCFMPVFFQELCVDGQIDRAMAVARREVRERSDAWAPVLFSRLKSGRIWYVPGFSRDGHEFEHWNSLKTYILEKCCTPIIGPGLAEPWLGKHGEIARRWAEENGYPFAPSDLEDLPRIAQYINQRDGPIYLQLAFKKAIREELIRRCVGCLPPDLMQAAVWEPEMLLRALEIASSQPWAQAGNTAHRQLAALKLPIYITTSPSSLLTQALRQAGVDPQVRLCPWWDQHIPEPRWRYIDEPTPQKPLVYHLFGHLDTPKSLVISEDNYFDFLIGITRNRELIPDTVVNALTSTALLFVGFRSEEWGFRVLFRTLMAQEGSEQLRQFTHVTAQVEPEEGRLIDTRRARRFLEKAFDHEKINIYWGRSEEFLDEIDRVMGG